jgi:hypothetical protein
LVACISICIGVDLIFCLLTSPFKAFLSLSNVAYTLFIDLTGSLSEPTISNFKTEIEVFNALEALPTTKS